MAIEIMSAFTNEPPLFDYVLPNMVAGTVGAIVAPGGVGKSMLALQLAVQIAGGPDLLEMGKLMTGHVAYLPAEDPTIAIYHRLYALGASLTYKQQQSVANALMIEPLIGKSPNVMSSEWFDDLHNIAKNRRLLILDTLRRFHIEEENASGPMAQVIAKMEAISTETNCSIIFLHHSSKGAAMRRTGDQQQASRGSSVLVDNIRWQSYLSAMTPEEATEWGIELSQRNYFVRFGISKANYGEPFTERWFQRHEGGVLLPVTLTKKKRQNVTRNKAVVMSDDDNW